MTKEEAIKYLHQLYPNGGHCWLDEQRIEAIDMAVKALREEPVSEEFNAMCLDENGNPTLAKETDFTRGFVKGAQWQKRKDSASVSEELEEAAEAWSNNDDNTGSCDYIGVTVCEYAFKAGAKWQKAKDESTTEDLSEYINKLSKQFPEVSFAKLSRIAVRVAKWQKEQMMANTANAMIGLPYENKDGGYTHLIDVSRPLPVGNNKIAIIFKED